MDLLQYYNSINLEELNRFIEEGQEENISLEFKIANHPYNGNSISRDADKHNYSKVLSGFANSVGGILIWGINTSNKNGLDIASKMQPIIELTKFLNELNRLEGLAVTPTIRGVIHKKIEAKKGSDIGFIKSYIPESESAPHMALFAEKYYYKRNGDSFYKCEHYDIIDILNRKKSAYLKLSIKIDREINSNTRVSFKVLISILNSGNTLAKFPYVAIDGDASVWQYEYGLDDNRLTGLKRIKNNTEYKFNYSGGNEVVVYPKTKLDIDFFTIEKSKPLSLSFYLAAENFEVRKEKIQIDKFDIGDEFIY